MVVHLSKYAYDPDGPTRNLTYSSELEIPGVTLQENGDLYWSTNRNTSLVVVMGDECMATTSEVIHLAINEFIAENATLPDPDVETTEAPTSTTSRTTSTSTLPSTTPMSTVIAEQGNISCIFTITCVHE